MNSNDNYEFMLERLNIPDTIVLDKPEHIYTCGRGKDNQIVCLSLTVSRHHCIFVRGKDGLYVSDLQSSNGIYINGIAQEPHQMIKLSENDIIGIGCPHVNVTDNSMFAYKLCIIRLQTTENRKDASVLSKTVLNSSNTSIINHVTSKDEPDVTFRRKREKSVCDAVIPNKIIKLDNNECHSSDKPSTVSGKCEEKSENEIEIVHVSLRNDMPMQNDNNCDRHVAEHTEAHNAESSKKCTANGLFIKNNNKQHSNEHKSVQSNSNTHVHAHSEDVKPQILDDIKSVKNMTNAVNACNDTEQLNKGTTLQNNANKKRKGKSTLNSRETSSNQRKGATNVVTKKKKARCNKKKEKPVSVNLNANTTSSVQNMQSTAEQAISDGGEACTSSLQTTNSRLTRSRSGTEDQMLENLKSVPSSTVFNGDTVIKMEDELQLTDTDEEAMFNAINTDPIPASSPLKLKKIQQAPKTRFSEVDIVNLSDNEDDIFPCSQLFDTGFGVDTSNELKVKEELTDMENDRFSRVDDTDIVIELTDSEDEDSTWLQRLSRSQIFNEADDIDSCNIKKEDIKEEIGIVNNSIHAPDNSVCRSQLLQSCKSVETGEKHETEIQKHTSQEQNKLHRLQDVISINVKRALYTGTEETMISDSAMERHIHREGNNSKEDIQQKAMHISTHTSNNDIEIPTVYSKQRNLVEKKVPEIEPPFLPTGKRRRSSIPGKSKEVPEKIFPTKLSAKEKKELQEKSRMEQHLYNREQKHRKILHKWADCLPPSKKKGSALSKEEKRILARDRKEKLKKIAMEEKRTSLNDNQEKRRTVSKPKAKVSEKTRGDFLVNEQASLSVPKLGESEEKQSHVTNSFATAENNVPTLKIRNATKTKISPENDTDKLTKDLQCLSVLTDHYDKSKTQRNASNSLEVKTTHSFEEALKAQMLNQKKAKVNNKATNIIIRKEVKDKLKSDFVIPIMKQYLPDNETKTTSVGKQKKRVSFSAVLQTVHEYQIEPQNILRKFAGKDAPIPVEKLPIKATKLVAETSPRLEEFLLSILSWNPVWLEEQQHLNSIAPVVRESDLHPMLTHYKSYTEYYKIALPLLLLEIWCGITKEFQSIEQNYRRPTLMCSIVESSIVQTNIPSTNVHLTTLMLEVLATREDIRKQAYPNYGDLVFFEYVQNMEKGQTFHKIFAYVTNVYQTVLTSTTHYNKDLKIYVKNPHTLLTFTMLTRPLENDIPVNRVQRLRAITYLRPSLRMVQALQYLPNSPLINLILYPKIDMYQLPASCETQTSSLVTKDILNQKQLEAVSKVTEAVIQKEAKLCFIQGPPGTGKSKVIVNIITQILYGQNRYSNKGSLRILVCAPSNAAIDEIVLRLLHIRSTIKQNRFKLVRFGRPEVMHPAVKDISVTELAKRDVKKTASCYFSSKVSIDSVEEEKLFLEARINALKCEIANSHKIDETYKKHIKMKLSDMTAKYELLKTPRPIDEINPKELAKLQRVAENRLLQHADIITCTLSSCYTNQMESIFGGNRERISVCIVDEATQSCEAETLIPLMLGVNTLVLVGDPNQLPATILSQQAKKLGLDQSIFSRVQNAFDGQLNNPIITLDTQYRMQYEISFWPNKFFYGGKLKNAPECSLKFPFYPYRVLNLNTCQNNDKFSNTNEAEFVANMISSMISSNSISNWEQCISVGVLTPYNNQRFVILAKIDEKMSSVPENLRRKMRIEVNTVDSFQGQERDIIIMSCVRSQGIGFLSDKQRLCVALTRAKHSLILCGNFNVFMRDPMWNSLLSDARARRKYFNVSANAQPHEIKTIIIKQKGKV